MSDNTSPIEIVIRVQGILQRQTAFTMGLFSDTQSETDAPPITTLTGALRDEAELAGVLDRLYVLGLPLISVEREEPDRAAEPDQLT